MTRRQKKTLLTLAAVVAVLAVVLALLARFNRNRADGASSAAESAVTDVNAQYSALTWNNGTSTLSFTRGEDGVWLWDGDPAFPLNQYSIEKILNTISGLVPQQTISDCDALADYGLDTPSMTLTAVGGDGASTILALGNQVTGDSGSYYLLMNENDSVVYVVSDALHGELDADICDLMELPQLPIPDEAQITGLNVEGAVSTLLSPTVVKTDAQADSSAAASSSGGESVTVTWRSQGANVTDNESAKSLISTMRTLTLAACQDYKPTDEAAALCGFGAPRASVTMAYTDDGGKAQALTLTVGSATADGTGFYVRLEGDSTIYSMTSDSLQAIISVADSGLSA